MPTKLRKYRRSQVHKANPTPGDVHVNVPLTNISVAYVQDASVFVADQVFPLVPVAQQSNVYYLFNKSDFLRDQAKPRAPGTESAGSGFAVTTAPYACLVEAFHKDIDDQLRANADSVLGLDRAATEFVTQVLLVRRERKWVNAYFKTGVWGTDVTGVASGPSTGQFLRWDVSTADPLPDVETGKMTILGATGFMPQLMVMGAQVFSGLRNNAKIRDQFKFTSSDSIDTAMMAKFFGVDRLLVMNGVYESANEGATSSMAFIGGKNALLCYTASSPSLMTPTAGYTFAWTGFTGGTNGWRIKRIRADLIASDRIEGETATDMKVVAAAMGYFFSTAVS